ncbi:hypothetical protein BDQ17DRAFT_1352508 [Cyathus striatus]|nr:hypothetical protein BDQ17DRAFT_1352508 [Cyathus striatus]
MEDPWENAWGDPNSKPPYTTPATHHQDLEADLSVPSWTIDSAIKWDEPSDTAGSLWKRESTPISNPSWVPPSSPYDSIPLGNSPPQSNVQPFDPTQPVSDPTLSPAPQLPSFSQEAPSPIPLDSEPPLDDFVESSPTPPSQTISEPFEPGSPDAFGTFETAILSDSVDVDPWTPAQPSFPSPEDTRTDAWGAPAWDAPQSASTVEDDAYVDEWEAAKQQKEKLDRHVPPELLASILRQLDELSADLWPSTDAEPSFNHSWKGDSAETLGLTSVVNRLVPDDLTLPPIVQFPQTFTCKRATETLRLTRNLPVTRLSPINFYLTSKGSTSWEASVKSRPDKTEEDAAPVGWRLLEKREDEVPTVDDGKKKPSGGLFSFFGKKSSAGSETSTVTRAASPSRASVSSTPRPSVAGTPRVSMDSIKSGSKTTSQVAAGVASSTTSSSLKSPTTLSFHSPTTQKQPDIFSSPGNTPLQPEEARPVTPPAPSAVSRFWGRFSRNKSNASNPHNSVALSSDDIEFLSDIVPSASDLDNDDDAALGALTNMIQSSPLPTKLPPPLAPPPKAPPPLSAARTPSSNIDAFASFLEAPIRPAPLATMIPSVAPVHSQSVTFLQSVPPPENVASSSSAASTSDKDTTWPAFDFDESPSHVVPAALAHTPLTRHTPAPQYPLVSSARSPPVPLKRTFTAVMSNASTRSSSPAEIPRFDSSNLSTNLPPLSHVSVPPTTLSIPSLPPPPSSRAQTPQISTLIISDTHSPLSRSRSAAVEGSAAFDDDEFSDFLSSPAQPTPSNSFSSGFLSTSVSQPLTGTSFQTGFDDFDDFVSPSLPTPSPPKPPSKSPLIYSSALPPGPVFSAPTHQKPKSLAPRKAFGAPDHQRTLSLMESAAARGKWLAPPSPLPMAIPPPNANNNQPKPDASILSGSHNMQQQQAITLATQNSHQRTLSLLESAAARGKWPAPPSPLPMAIPPPDVHNQSKSDVDLLSEDHSMQQQQAMALAALSPSASSADVFNREMSEQTFPQPRIVMSNSRSPSPSIHLLAPTSSNSRIQRQSGRDVNISSTNKTGGLSAQDLSFFEGL